MIKKEVYKTEDTITTIKRFNNRTVEIVKDLFGMVTITVWKDGLCKFIGRLDAVKQYTK